MAIFDVTIGARVHERSPRDGGEIAITIDTDPAPRVLRVSFASTGSNGLIADESQFVSLNELVTAVYSAVISLSGEESLGMPRHSPVISRPAESVLLTPVQNSIEGSPQNGTNRVAINSEDPPVRAYRRMPDAAEVLNTYEAVGTISALAREYGVPRHTAQGWMSRLRRLPKPTTELSGLTESKG